LEKHQPGARYHATAESGIDFRSIARAIGDGLGLPTVSVTQEEATTDFGWMSGFVAQDMSSRSEKTRTRLGWEPRGPGLITDLGALFNH
jgi:nucleoside-diphosphate-sugar epimerase